MLHLHDTKTRANLKMVIIFQEKNDISFHDEMMCPGQVNSVNTQHETKKVMQKIIRANLFVYRTIQNCTVYTKFTGKLVMFQHEIQII